MLQLILTQPLQPAQLVLGVRRLRLPNECDWGGNYDIGHYSGLPVEVEMLDASAACVFPTINIPLGKGAYTSPADGVPQGDTFDIDFVVHEIGHQLGANHTFRMSWKKLL
jgi:hypothetical protein